MKKFVIIIIAVVIVIGGYFLSMKIGDIIEENDAQKKTWYHRKTFSEEIVTAIRKSVAGYWVLDKSSKEVDITDRIELLENGIMWRVNRQYVTLPSGKQHLITIVTQGFIKPIAEFNDDKNHYTCETAIVKQAVLSGNDTCYNSKSRKENWSENITLKRINNSELLFNKEKYTFYKCKDLTKFFPPNVLDIVDNIAIKKCPGIVDIHGVNTNILNIDVDNKPIDVKKIITQYYIPLCLKPFLKKKIMKENVDGNWLECTISFNGSKKISDVKISSSVKYTNFTIDKIQNEIKAWNIISKDGKNVSFKVIY